MWHILADRAQDSENQWLYLLAIVVMVVISTIAERIKKLMSGDREQPGKPSRPPVPPLRRPRIPQVPERREPSPRSMQPEFPMPPPRPTAPPRPTVRPPSPTPTPVAERSVEERKAILRGQPIAEDDIPRKATPTAPQTRALEDSESASATKSQMTARTMGLKPQLRSTGQLETARVREAVAARSFRKLSVADLQRAIVLKEILEPPLALRNA